MMRRQRLYGLYLFAWLLLAACVIRLLFFFRYWYHATSVQELMAAFGWGFRFDFSLLFFLNLPFVIYWRWVYPRGGSPAKIFLWTGFWGMNLLVIAINLFDLVYFGFNSRRSTLDLLYVLSDGFTANKAGFAQYVGLFLLWLIIAFVAYRMVKAMLTTGAINKSGTGSNVVWVAGLLAGWLFASDAQFRPFTPSDALLHMETSQVPLAENSATTFLYSLVKRQKGLQPLPANKEALADSLFSIRRQYPQTEGFRKMNVVLFILESFSASVVDSGSASKALTPFIDSIRRQSIDCSNALSNGLESNKGIVALLGSIPPLLEEPFYYSVYNTVPFRGIGTILKDSGYQTSFFMGASPDHFGFGKWCRMLGIDHYYSEKEYGHAADHDGHWGIFDHKFLPYAAETLARSPRPFFATVFNVSSHPPFVLPEELAKQFSIPKQSARQNSISYTDYALRLFFDRIKNEPWYKNTLFVFAADHVLLERRNVRSDLYNYMRIPIFLHIPGEAKRIIIDQPVQQLDIVPTIMDLLHYNRPFMSFGNSIFREHNGFSVCRIFDTQQMVDSSFVTGYYPPRDSVLYFYNYRADTALAQNLVHDPTVKQSMQIRQQQLRAFGQRFNQALARRQLFIQ